jgi:hypothetical protein
MTFPINGGEKKGKEKFPIEFNWYATIWNFVSYLMMSISNREKAHFIYTVLLSIYFIGVRKTVRVDRSPA